MMTPGWAEIKELADHKKKALHYEALAESDPTKYPEKHRIAWAATMILEAFLEELNEHTND
jgi:hypothetical protein